MHVIRRNNSAVNWNSEKVKLAVTKAFIADEADVSKVDDVVRRVEEKVSFLNSDYIHIEQIQDIVESALMECNCHRVAKRYILYRDKRGEKRRVAIIDKKPSGERPVKVRDGDKVVDWYGYCLRERIRFGMVGLDLCLSYDEILTFLRKSIFDNITADGLKQTIIMNAKSLIERDADFAIFAGRILLSYIYEEALNWRIEVDGIATLRKRHQEAFIPYINKSIELGSLDDIKVKLFDIHKLSKMVDPTTDMDFDLLGIQCLYDRYLFRDRDNVVFEVPQFMWMRVAMGLAVNEKESDRIPFIESLYNLYRTRRFCSSTPTLFNSLTNHPQLSSCYLYWVDDSLKAIFKRGISDCADLSKWAGGLGGSWSSVRGSGSFIQGTKGESQGVIPFINVNNAVMIAVNQGGKRRGAGCAYLEPWHPDFMEFLELKRNTGDDRRRTHDLNTACWIPDLLIQRVERREDWAFFSPSDAPDLHHIYGKEFEERFKHYENLGRAGKIAYKSMPAIEVWKKMLSMLFETAHPWFNFKDPCNIRNPQKHVGVIHSSNLCTEITLNTSEDEIAVCNLGSIVLDRHINKNGVLEKAKLRDTIRTAIRALDNVIDINFYPVEAARESNEKHRPIGLGLMGLQYALYKKNIPFESEEAVRFGDEVMEIVSYYAIEASIELAKERGKYSSYKGSLWDQGKLPMDTVKDVEEIRGVSCDLSSKTRMDWDSLREKLKEHGMRNSNVLAIAPTATIANIMRTSPCIEPLYKNIFVKSNLSGDHINLNPYLVKDLKKLGKWDKDMLDTLKYHDGELSDIDGIPEDIKKMYKTAFGVDYKFVVDAAAERQKWIDQSQSVNLWLDSPDLKILSHMYRYVWRKGLKTTYYLRTLGASRIEKATVDLKIKEVPKACDISDPNCDVCQ